jgi:hypothetical protein
VNFTRHKGREKLGDPKVEEKVFMALNLELYLEKQRKKLDFKTRISSELETI